MKKPDFKKELPSGAVEFSVTGVKKSITDLKRNKQKYESGAFEVMLAFLLNMLKMLQKKPDMTIGEAMTKMNLGPEKKR